MGSDVLLIFLTMDFANYVVFSSRLTAFWVICVSAWYVTYMLSFALKCIVSKCHHLIMQSRVKRRKSQYVTRYTWCTSERFQKAMPLKSTTERRNRSAHRSCHPGSRKRQSSPPTNNGGTCPSLTISFITKKFTRCTSLMIVKHVLSWGRVPSLIKLRGVTYVSHFPNRWCARGV